MPWPDAPDSNWLPKLSDSVTSDELKRVLAVAAVEPMRAGESNTAPSSSR